MTDTPKPSTLRQLRESGWQSKTVKREIYDNFLAALAARPELIATRDLRVLAGDPKQKTLNVRITVAGLVPKSLAPKKGA